MEGERCAKVRLALKDPGEPPPQVEQPLRRAASLWVRKFFVLMNIDE